MDDYGLFLVGVVVAGTLLTVLWFMAVYRDDLGHERREAKRKVFEQRLKDSHEKEKLRELAAESERRRERQAREWMRDKQYREALHRYDHEFRTYRKPLTPPVLYKSRSTSSQRSSRREGISFDLDSISDIAQAGYEVFQWSGDSTPSHSSHDSSSSHSSSSHSCSGSSSCSSTSSSCGSSSP